MTDTSKVRKLLGAAATLGSGSILKAVGKIAPGIGSFVSGAYTAGYASDQIADFLRNKFTTPEQKRNLSNLNRRTEANVARPDEREELTRHEQRMAPFETVAGIGKLLGQAGGGIATAASSASAQREEQEQQRQIQEQTARQQQDLQQRREEESAFSRERQMERDLENRKYREAAERRAAEKHKMSMERGSRLKAPEPKTMKTISKPPETYLDALRELDDLIHRLP